jgi:hypothetical protein
MNKTLEKVPGIGDIPILGLLFKSQAAQKQRTELVVMITPEILRGNSPGVTRDVPRLQEPLMPTLEQKKSTPMPPPAFPPQPSAALGGPGAAPVASSSAPAASDSAAAAERVRALMPSTTPGAVHNETMPATSTPGAVATPPTAPSQTPGQPRTTDRSRQTAHDRDEAAKAAEGKVRAKQLDQDRKKEAEATRASAEAAKRQAVVDRAAADAAAKRQAEQAKKQAVIDKKNQKAVAEAEAKLKAAQSAYDAEVAKTKKPQPQDRQ